MTLVRVACPVCGGTEFDTVFPSTIADPESDPARYFSSSRRRAGHLDIVRCRLCSMMLTNPRDDDATLARIYTELEDLEYATEEDNRRHTAEDHCSLIGAYLPRQGRLLDVGCATGVFAGVALRRGWDVTGLDASKWATARARERCPGAAFVTGSVEETVFPPATFSAITLWDVLEHVPDPFDTLRQLYQWLVPGGWLFLNVPNADSAVARIMGKHWVLLLREHLWYFAPQTLARLFSRGGFELIRTRANQVRFSVGNVAGRSAQYPNVLGGVAKRLAGSQWLRRPTVRFPIGEMTVVARRALVTAPTYERGSDRRRIESPGETHAG
jgi:2-polyprenyl-3-methyl-5-hydroxy-6-metoxy-1,4-benzoquinol methylase